MNLKSDELKIDRLTVEFEKLGLGVFFKPYQSEIIRYMINNKEQSSREVYEHLLFIAEINISRASVIKTLQMFENWGLLKSESVTGKGGRKPLYNIMNFISNEVDVITYIHYQLSILFELNINYLRKRQ